MKLRIFFLNCLNRRSFQFLNYVGIVFILILLFIAVFCIIKNITAYGFWVFWLYFFSIIFPTLVLVSILSILIIYIKLLINEYKNPEYRIKNRFLTQNPVYGFFAVIFYIFALITLGLLLYLEGLIFTLNLDIIQKEIITWPIFLYPFIIYTLIHIFMIFKI